MQQPSSLTSPAYKRDLSKLKITRVEATWLRASLGESELHVSDFGAASTFDVVVVAIYTSSGIVGYGEAKNSVGSFSNNAGLVTIINDEVGKAIVGKDPRNITLIREMLYSGSRLRYALQYGRSFPELSRRGLYISAMSGIDIALWDILGKYYDTPLYALLGGAVRRRVPVYGSGGWGSVESIGDEVRDYVSRYEISGVKIRVGAMDYNVEVSAERTRAARSALGGDYELMVDAHGTFSLPEAKEYCNYVADLGLSWIEEPISIEDAYALRELRSSTAIPIAVGESEFTRYDFKRLVEARLIDIVQPDVAICGGVSEFLAISSVVSSFNLQLAPHMWSGPIAFAASMQLACSLLPAVIVEMPIAGNPMLNTLTKHEWRPESGYLNVPDGPGLGIEWNTEAFEVFRII